MKPAALILLLSHACMQFSFAADRVPKEMRPKLIREGKVLVQDGFDSPELDKKWTTPRGQDAGTVTIENGRAVISSGAGRQGVLLQRLEPDVTDASIQLLMKPTACKWMGVRFTSTDEVGNRKRHWSIATAIYETGYVRAIVPDGDGTELKVLKSAKAKVKTDEWWRVSVESKGDRYFIRVNGEDLIDIKAPETEGRKYAVLVNLYGGKGEIDEVKVMAAAK